MTTDNKGCSTAKKRQESFETFTNRGKTFYQYDYRHTSGQLFSCVRKETDSRTANWGGLGQVELDAVEPHKLQDLCRDAIDSVFDYELYDKLIARENDERVEYKIAMKQFVENMF